MMWIKEWVKTFFSKPDEAVDLQRDEIDYFSIPCNPTFWRFIDDQGKIIEDAVDSYIVLLDMAKIRKLLNDHLHERYKGKSPFAIAMDTKWDEAKSIIKHIEKDHFNECKLKYPMKKVEYAPKQNVLVAGMQNILTGKELKYRIPKTMVVGDVIVYHIESLSWDLI